MNIPSANNSTNERNVRRQNCKDQIKRAADAKKVLMSVGEAHAKFDKLATAFNAAKKVIFVEGNRYRVFVGSGAKFYPVYLICGSFKCDCRDHANYGFCSHTKAAAMFAADVQNNKEEANRLEESAVPCGCRCDADCPVQSFVYQCDTHRTETDAFNEETRIEMHEEYLWDKYVDSLAEEEAGEMKTEYFHTAGEIDRSYQEVI